MDIQRTQTKPRVKRQVLIGALVVVALAVTVAVAQLRPANVPVRRSAVMTDTVRRGTLARTVRGSGRLAPEHSRWIAASTDARVEKILLQPGSRVTAETILIELSDPQQQQQVADAQWQLRAAEADYESVKASLKVERLNQQAANAQLRAEFEAARLRSESDDEMSKQGIVAEITRRLSATNADALRRRLSFDDHRLEVGNATLQSRLASQKADVEQRRALYNLRRSQVEALRVPAGIDGVLQEVSVEPGQRVAAGTTLARVVQPERLKAEIRIAESAARDIAIGQPATVDTYNGKVAGVISRVDPAAREGAVTIDIRITGPLPQGTRPDLNVEATIELGRLADTLYVGRPVGAQENSPGIVFRLLEQGAAERVQVVYGRSSADSIEIRQGLRAGDEIIVSQSSAWNEHERIDLK